MKTLYRWILFLFAAVMLYIAVLVIFLEKDIPYAAHREFLLGNPLLLLIGMVLTVGAAAMFGGNARAEAFLRTHSRRALLGISLILFILQVYVCYNAYFETGWDVGLVMIPNARMIAEGRLADLSNEYFSTYPNNVLLLFLFSVIMKADLMAGMLDTGAGLMGIISVQCVLSCISGYLLFQVILKAFGCYRLAWGGWLLYLILLGTSPWLMIPYSDSFGLVFPILILWLYQSAQSGRHRQWKWGAMALAAYWGYHLKPQVLLVFLAIVTVEGIALFNRQKKMQVLLHSGIWVMVGCLMVSVFLYGQIVRQTGLSLDEEKAFGVSHYLMMGLNSNSNGTYSYADVSFSEEFDTVKERRAANLEEALRRIREYGPDGLGRHLVRKTLNNFADGTFAWSLEGEFYRVIYPPKNTVISPLLRSVLWEGGRFHPYFNTWKQMTWLVVLVLSVGMAIPMEGESFVFDKVQLAAVIALLGLTVFQLLFEARARYLYLYVPLYIVTAVQGLRGWKGMIIGFVRMNRKNKNKNKNIKLEQKEQR